jgi:hypothetical protein
MTNEIEEFIKSYSKAIVEGDAAVFAGAGLSVPSGYVGCSKLGEKSVSPRKGTGYHPTFVEYQRTGQYVPLCC